MLNENQLKRSRLLDADIDIPVPKGKGYLPHQKAAVYYALYNTNINTLIADDQGVGKTIEAIGFINFIEPKRVLIICPASLLTNWEIELKEWLVRPRKIQKIMTGNDRIDPKAEIYIVSFDLARIKKVFDKLKKLKYLVMIIDEVQYLKSRGSKRTRAILGRGGEGGLKEKAGYVLALSGTPLPNRPIELFPILLSLCPSCITNPKTGHVMDYDTFGMKYCGGFYDRLGHPNYRGASNLKELGERLRSGFMIRRTKKQVLPNLPDRIKRIVYLNTDDDCERIIKRTAAFDISELSKGRIATSYEGLAEMQRELGVLKAPKAVEYLKVKLEGGYDKIGVFAWHTDVIDILREGLTEFGLVEIIGSTPKRWRDKAVKEFQNNKKVKVFLANRKVAGVGLTLTAADYCALVEPSWVFGENEQVIDRFHRIGQKKSVLAEFLVLEKSLDERILKAHMTKAENIKTVLEG